MSAQAWWVLEDALVILLALTCAAWAFQEWRARCLVRGMVASAALLASLGLVLGGFRIGVATGFSMAPTLASWNVTLVSLPPIWHKRTVVHAGDVVLFSVTDPLTGLPQTLAKRVVAVEGQSLQYRSGKLKVNGNELVSPVEGPQPAGKPPGTQWKHVMLEEKKVTVWAPVTGMPDIRVDQVVPAGRVFVLGDHWANSWDSRDFGPIPAQEIRGKVVAAWSLENGWKRL